MRWLRNWLLAEMLAALKELQKGQVAILAGVAELEAAISDVRTAVAAETDRVEAVIAALKAGGDLGPQIAELESIKDALNAVEQAPGP